MRRIVGVVGGMGPLATNSFFHKLISQTEAVTDQDHLHVVIDSNATIPDRTAYIRGAGPDPRPLLIESALRLQAAGAELLVMPCNTAHAFAPAIRDAVSIPLVDWIATASDEVVAHGPAVAGILATSGTLETGLYQGALKARGVAVVTPSQDEVRLLMQAIYGADGVKAGQITERCRAIVLAAGQRLASRGANILVLGCTELPIAVAASDPGWPCHTVDPAIAVARATILLAGGRIVSRPKTPRPSVIERTA